MQKDNNEKRDLATVYEVSYILLPSLATEQVPAKVETIVKMVETAGGELVSSENPVLIDLAYPMTKVVHTNRQKCDKGYFGWMKFEMDREGVKDVKKNLDNDEQILRYLIIKTVRENTLLNGKMQLRGESEEKKEKFQAKDIDVSTPESTPEEIDKSIDDLVIA